MIFRMAFSFSKNLHPPILGRCLSFFQMVQLVIQYKGECEGEANGNLGTLSVTLLLPELIPVVILQGLDNVILRLLGGEVLGDIGL